jgi:hypothetical protein
VTESAPWVEGYGRRYPPDRRVRPLAIAVCILLSAVLLSGYLLAFKRPTRTVTVQTPAAPAPAAATPTASPPAPNRHTGAAIYSAPGQPPVTIFCDNAGFRVLQVYGAPEATRYVRDVDSCPPRR